jgi:SAM-dependent methyltransferase
VPTTEDKAIIDHFGREWQAFSHDNEGAARDLTRFFDDYFHIFPWDELPEGATGADVGCGTGRVARFVAPRVGRLYCCDPSAALEVARAALANQPNCEFVKATADSLPFEPSSLDFAYCLGVLHHVSNTEESLQAIASKLRPGAPFLLYLYYALENRPFWYRMLWFLSDVPRKILSRAPFPIRRLGSELIAAFLYWPLARFALLVEKLGGNPDNLPLSWYRSKRFYFLRGDALDRFGTRVEKRYTRAEMQAMMERAGLERIVFSERPPFWTAVGRRR